MLCNVESKIRHWADIGHFPSDREAGDVYTTFGDVLNHYNLCYNGLVEEVSMHGIGISGTCTVDLRCTLAHPRFANTVFVFAMFEGVRRNVEMCRKMHRLCFHIRRRTLRHKTVQYLISASEVSQNDWSGRDELFTSLEFSRTIQDYAKRFLGLDHVVTLLQLIRAGAFLCQVGELAEAEALLSKAYELIKSW